MFQQLMFYSQIWSFSSLQLGLFVKSVPMVTYLCHLSLSSNETIAVSSVISSQVISDLLGKTTATNSFPIELYFETEMVR